MGCRWYFGLDLVLQNRAFSLSEHVEDSSEWVTGLTIVMVLIGLIVMMEATLGSKGFQQGRI